MLRVLLAILIVCRSGTAIRSFVYRNLGSRRFVSLLSRTSTCIRENCFEKKTDCELVSFAVLECMQNRVSLELTHLATVFAVEGRRFKVMSPPRQHLDASATSLPSQTRVFGK